MSGAAAITTSPKLCYSLGGPARVRGEPEIQVGIDTIAKRYFPAIVCLLLLVILKSILTLGRSGKGASAGLVV